MIWQVVPSPHTLSLADSTATYLIVGGAGGVGRSIAEWMMKKGAMAILLVSRKAESSPDVSQLLLAAERASCRIHIRNCDVSDESDFTRLMSYCSDARLPPIKGVINCAMVLDVRTL